VSDGETLWEKNGRDPIGQELLLGFSALDISADGKVLATAMGYEGKQIQLWKAENGERLGVLDGHTGYLCNLTFSRDGSIPPSASNHQTIRLWDTASWHESAAPLRGNGDEVHGIAFAPDGKSLATAAK